MEGLFKACVEAFGTVDVVVNNAGVSRDKLVAGMKLQQDWQQVIDINLTGVFLCTKAAFKVFLLLQQATERHRQRERWREREQ